MDPLPEQMAAAKAVGADRIGAVHRTLRRRLGHARAARTTAALHRRRPGGPGRWLGHQRRPRPEPRQPPAFVAAVPGLLEVSIGHAFIADALELGYTDTGAAPTKRCIDQGMQAQAAAPLMPGCA